jgi:hypothetical protein
LSPHSFAGLLLLILLLVFYYYLEKKKNKYCVFVLVALDEGSGARAKANESGDKREEEKGRTG